MERLVDDLLWVARQGDVVTDPQDTHLGAIVQLAWEGTDDAGASLELEAVDPIRADPDRLNELLENLFRNAVEHGRPGVTVRVGPLEDGLFIEDDGEGIPAEVREQVFDHGFTTNDDGTGYGLSVVRTIVGAHGWDVAVSEAREAGHASRSPTSIS